MKKQLDIEAFLRIQNRVLFRQMKIDDLRDIHRLNAVGVINSTSEQVTERRKNFEKDLDKCKKEWALEDEAINKEYGLDD